LNDTGNSADSNLLAGLTDGLAAMSGWEAAGVVLAFAYLVLAIRQNIWCWAAAAVSEIIFMFIMIEAKLYMESALRVFYLGMAAYGWYSWSGRGRPGGSKDDGGLPVSVWPWRKHVIALAAIFLLVVVSGYTLSQFTDAALPYWDSFTTWAAMIATWMVARKVLENWFYWFVIDAVSVWLYLERGLQLTAFLYAVYLVMIVIGYRQWRSRYLTETAPQVA